MASKSMAVKAAKNPDKFETLYEQIEAHDSDSFRKRDIGILDDDDNNLWGYLTKSETALRPVGFDDDANVKIWTPKHNVIDFLSDFCSQ